MKLLIVDDQLATLQGLVENIDWAAQGFLQVDTAANAMEARLSIRRQTPDVMLCDVEMPVENGMELCRWLREEGLETKIIFLTCHSDFQYAREAVELQASDYIVQPAAYETIVAKVAAVVDKLHKERREQQWNTLGRMYARKEKEIAGSFLRGFLNGTVSSKGFSALPALPDPAGEGRLLLVQLVRWTSAAERWKEDLLTAALQSFCEDIFSCANTVVAALMEKNTYAVCLQAAPGETLEAGSLEGRMQYLVNTYDLYMPCEVAVYPAAPGPVEAMPEQWKGLVKRRNQNITGKKGVIGSTNPAAAASYTAQAAVWKSLLEQQGAEAMEKEINRSLDRIAESGQLTAATLSAFCMDFNHMVALLWNGSWGVDELQYSEEWMALSQQAIHSVDGMRALVSQLTRSLQKNGGSDETGVVQQMIDFIRENLWEDIGREDVANHVHLNVDYAARLFRKETGESMKGYIIRLKLNEARNLLRNTSLSVSSVAVQLGYNNFSHFAAIYKKEFGISPNEERKSAEAGQP